MKDERIQTTVNRIAARGFAIWYVLMLISMYYRFLILKQHIRDFWDICAIFFIGTLYACIAYANKGVLGHSFTRRSVTIGIAGAAIIGFFTWQFGPYPMNFVVYVGTVLIGSLTAIGLWIGIARPLNRRWKRKEGIEDEK